MGCNTDVFRIGLAIPLQGPGGIFGPSCEAVAELAVARLNNTDGILGRPVEVEVLDAGAPVEEFCDHTMQRVQAGAVHAVVGWHISTVRQHMAPVLAQLNIPYVYTSLHEGAVGEAVLCPGETPAMQVLPGLRWLTEHLGLHRWTIVGSDYVWPRRTSRAVRAYAEASHSNIVGELYVRYGCRDFAGVLRDLERSSCDAVIMLLVGRDAVLFNRQFAASGMQDRMVRFSPLMEENMLLASGHSATSNLYVAAAYFNSLSTASAMDFTGSYLDRFGPHAPALNNAAESCYEGILALAASANAVHSIDSHQILATIEQRGVTYNGPRGTVHLGVGRSRQQVHIARADHYDFDIIATLPEPLVQS
ncbi:substrate-binding domain-containing protein [Mycobacterium sp. NPDC050441]|uniref:substrate-binding domain-containing protein n=1 Tax=Mycobacterium sp. NPDC050441 TaxID=3155403 RepID=UPI0033D939D7